LHTCSAAVPSQKVALQVFGPPLQMGGQNSQV
jgi:hypothetical protein